MPATPVNPDVGLDAVVTEPPIPDMKVHEPVPGHGVFPASVADVPQMI